MIIIKIKTYQGKRNFDYFHTKNRQKNVHSNTIWKYSLAELRFSSVCEVTDCTLDDQFLILKNSSPLCPFYVIKGEYLVKNTTDIRIDVIFYD